MNRPPLSPVQQRLWDFIQEFKSRHGIEPNHTEVQRAMDWNFSCGAHIEALRRKGYLEEAPCIRLPGSPWRTRQEALQLLDMPHQTLDDWRKRGWIQTIQRPNGCHVYPLAEIERVRAERAKPPLHFSDLALDPGWCHWLAGFTDGEGTFGLRPQSQHRGMGHYFQLFQRMDHVDVLEEIQHRLTVGHIYTRDRQGQTGPGGSYKIAARDHLVHVVIPLFDSYPLRVKQAAFSIWREAVLLIADGAALDDRRPQVLALHNALREAYKYNPEHD